VILPGAMLGVLGGGQLGRMFAVAARTLGYRVMVLDPDPLSPAGAMADEHLLADYQDPLALGHMGGLCAAITTEWENVPSRTLETLARHCPVRPGGEATAIARDRIREKTFVRDLGLATAPFFPILAATDLPTAVAALRLPALLKTATLGYDGKGQVAVSNLEEARAGFAQLGNVPCVLEEKVALHQELSVVLARGPDGDLELYPVGENVHRNGILHTTLVPGRVAPAVAERAIGMARTLAEDLDYVGVLAVEFFLARDGELLINEMAPRPHNSGHYSLDACASSQFEQQVRALCGLPLGSTRLLSPVVMVNLLGELWEDGEPDWSRLLAHPEVKLHLYGKHQARPGRKMGHFCVLGEDAEANLSLALSLHGELSEKSTYTNKTINITSN
jgi:5-(carboxyamino)imidazole ribonucleotide synthase